MSSMSRHDAERIGRQLLGFPLATRLEFRVLRGEPSPLVAIELRTDHVQVITAAAWSDALIDLHLIMRDKREAGRARVAQTSLAELRELGFGPPPEPMP